MRVIESVRDKSFVFDQNKLKESPLNGKIKYKNW